MKIRLTPYAEWITRAERVRKLGWPPMVFKTSKGSYTIKPWASEHRNLTILAGDWLPVHDDGTATYEAMIHSPQLYPAKSPCLRPDARGGLTSAHKVLQWTDRPLILVGGVTNLYHWLMDYLPRLLVIDQLEEFDDWAVLVNDDLSPFQVESLRMLDIPPSRLVRLEARAAIRSPMVCVPRLLSNYSFFHPKVPALLNQAFSPAPQTRGRCIYISRRDARNRRLVNEDELEVLLSRYGFERIVASDLSFAEQMEAFASAAAVVAVHGAALSNLVFAPAGTRVFEISAPRWRVTSMENIANARGHVHRYVDAEVATDWSEYALHNDWKVDLQDMEAALKAWRP